VEQLKSLELQKKSWGAGRNPIINVLECGDRDYLTV